MLRFQDYSIKRKLITIIITISSLVLVLACAAFITYDQITLKDTLQKDLKNLGAVFAPTTAASIEFFEEKSATTFLTYLQAREQIVSACLYASPDPLLSLSAESNPQDSSIFVKWAKSIEHEAGIPEKPGQYGVLFENGYFEIFEPVINLLGEQVGTLYIKYDAAELSDRLKGFSSAVAIILGCSFFVVLFLSARVQSIISDPILNLAKTAGEVSKNKDYSIRASQATNDEVGFLIERFNEMLTQIEKREGELNRVNLQLVESEKTALAATQTKSQFLASMSHELRTPLNAIIGYSELLQEEAEDAGHSDALPDLERIHSAGKHLLGLINDILDLSKVEAGKMTFFLETFQIKKLIDSVTSTINPMVAMNGNTLEVVCSPEIGSMHCDLTKVRQCLLNLLSNACKFTEKGTLRLEVSADPEEDSDSILFSVTDSGIGMTSEQMGRLFQAFSQADASTSKKYGGTGLGLALTKKFCNMLGGDLKVASELGKGSIFTIKLPRTGTEPGSQSPAPSTPESPRMAAPWKARILAIDDDPAVLNLIHRTLTKSGYHVDTASSGEEGIKMAKELRPTAIILDVILPGMDGWSVLNALKRDSDICEIPVVMVSFVDDQTKGFALGATDYITKPVDWKRLMEILKSFRTEDQTMEVLVVDDDRTTRELLCLAVSKAGYSIQEAENGRQALEKVRANIPGLILLDLMMPEMNGFQFVQALHAKKDWCRIPIIVMTSKDITPEEQRVLNGEVTKILKKGSYGMDELFEEIQRITSTLNSSQSSESTSQNQLDLGV